MCFLNFDATLNLPYLSPYIDFVYKNLMYIEGCNSTKLTVYKNLLYIEGCNSIKLTYMKLELCVSIHSHLGSISNVFLKF